MTRLVLCLYILAAQVEDLFKSMPGLTRFILFVCLQVEDIIQQ